MKLIIIALTVILLTLEVTLVLKILHNKVKPALLAWSGFFCALLILLLVYFQFVDSKQQIELPKPLEPPPPASQPPPAAQPPFAAQGQAVPHKASQEAQVLAFLEHWQESWQNSVGPQGDMTALARCYATDFSSKGLNLSEWLQDKYQKNRIKEWIRIELSDIRVHIVEGEVATGQDPEIQVSFKQHYSSSNYSDDSTKIMTLTNTPTGWQISATVSVINDERNQLPPQPANNNPDHPTIRILKPALYKKLI